MASNRLKPPKSVRIDFKPSPRQYELWKLLQPDACPFCGGGIEQVLTGYDANRNPQYKPECQQCHNQDLPQLILGGGAAGGGKSYVGSVWLISSCIRFENLRAVVARKTLKSLKESTWNTIKSILKDWGLKEDLNFKINNLEGTLTFWNDSVIIMKEMADIPSDPNFERFGSAEYTIAFVDEVSEISEKAIEVLFSRLRWRTHETFKTSRMLMTTNPTVNWVRSRFVQDDNGEKVITREGEAYVPFSVYDNPNIAFRQTYEAALNKIRDHATKERLLYGNWDFVEANDMAIYNKFDGSKHLVTGLKEQVYNPAKPLVTVWDFNVAPQMSSLTAQIDYENKKVYVLEEILGKPEHKENNTPALSRKMKNKLYRDKHIGGVDVTGDPAGLQRSTTNEDGVNNFTIILDTLGSGVLRPKLKLLKKQPPQVTLCDFVNEVFTGYDGWQIRIDVRHLHNCCRLRRI
jgi:PBSX family phage terminase large subunit